MEILLAAVLIITYLLIKGWVTVAEQDRRSREYRDERYWRLWADRERRRDPDSPNYGRFD